MENSGPLKKEILILCTGNSCRSQMAEAYFRFFASGRVEAVSAGTRPQPVHPLAIQVMQEDGIDISRQESKSVDAFRYRTFDYIITVCDKARENCPYFPGRGKRIHHSFDDPAAARGTDAEILREFRRVQNEIKNWVRDFVSGEWGDLAPAASDLS